MAQFIHWLARVLHGDLGTSITNHRPVLPLVLERAQVSAIIVLTAVALATLVAVPLGLIAAWRQNSLLDLGVVGTATLLLSIPSFWLGLLLLMFFGLTLGWLPVVGYVPMRSGVKCSVTLAIPSSFQGGVVGCPLRAQGA